MKKVHAALFLTVGIILLVVLTPTIMMFIGLPVAIVALVNRKSKVGVYGHHLWIGFDKFYNAILGGDHRETISSRLGKSIHYGKDPVFIWIGFDKSISYLLDQVDPNHCKKSIDWSVGDTNYPMNNN